MHPVPHVEIPISFHSPFSLHFPKPGTVFLQAPPQRSLGHAPALCLSVWSNLGLSPFPSSPAVVTKTTNLHNFESSTFTRPLLGSPFHSSERSLIGVRESPQFPQLPKPVRHQHGHRSNRSAVLPQTALSWTACSTRTAQEFQADDPLWPVSSFTPFPPLPKLFPFTTLIPSQINSPLYLSLPHWLCFCWLYTLICWFWYSCPGISCLGPQFCSTNGSLSFIYSVLLSLTRSSYDHHQRTGWAVYMYITPIWLPVASCSSTCHILPGVQQLRISHLHT